MRVRPLLLGLHHVALNVRDLPVMKRFYVEVLGFRVEWEPDAENVYLTSGTDNLALHAEPPGTAETGRRAADLAAHHPLDHIGLIVPSKADVDAWAIYLQEADVALEGGGPRTHRDGARSLYIRDPENNRVQIIYHPPISDRLA
jgi:catechol 2,3-dioxygenase-like lactoylglutathione lyase family enzyme